MLITIISLKMPLHSDITSKTEKDKFISTMSISMFFIVVCAIGFVILKVRKFENIYYQIFFIVIMLSLFILEIANIGTNIFKNLEDDTGTTEDKVFRLINPKFNASIALILLFSTFCLLCAIHTGVYSFKFNNFWYYLLLLLFMSCLFLFILMSSLDLNFKGDEADKKMENKLKSIVDIFLTFKWFAFFIPLIIYISNILLNKEEFKKNDIEKSFIKSLVLYYALLFLVFLFYVYFMNKESTVGILSLQYFQLYNFTSEKYYEKEKLSKESDNYFKSLNISNFIFVLFIIFLIIIFSLIYKNRDESTNTLILTIGMFIIASYTTGLVYLIYNTLFPIQQLSFDYKKQLIDINNEISSHIRTTTKEHTIDKNKIFNFNLFSKWSDVTDFKEKLNKKNGSKDKTKTEKLAIIKDEFRKIAPKGQNYDNYVDQSKDQKEYEEYILNIFDATTDEKPFNILNTYTIEQYIQEIFKEIKPVIEPVLKAQTPVLTANTTAEIKALYDFLKNDTIKKANQTDKDILKDILTKPYTDVSSKLTPDTLTYIKNSTSTSTDYNDAISKINKNINVIFIKPTKTQQETNIINNIIPTLMNMMLSKTYEELKLEIYTKLIIEVPKNLNELTDNNGIQYFTDSTKLEIPVSNNLEYIIKKNYKYVTGMDGEIQKYQYKFNKYTDSELNGLYWIKIPNMIPNANGFKIGENIYRSDTVDKKYNIITVEDKDKDKDKDKDRKFYFYTLYKDQNTNTTEIHKPDIYIKLNTLTTDENESISDDQTTKGLNTLDNVFETITINKDHKIYRMKDHFFNKIKKDFKDTTKKDDIHFFTLAPYGGGLNLFVSYNIIDTDITTTNSDGNDEIKTFKAIKETINAIVKEPIFYTIGYDYNNYKEKENTNQILLKDKLYTLPAKYYACSYLNYHPKSDDSMNTMKFKNYIDEKEYDLYNPVKDNIVAKIEKSYNKIVEITKKELNPEKFYFLLIFLVILSIIILMYLFTLIKYYFLEDLYSPQMVVLGILAVFLTVFIFGEVIFSRIK
jgi:hypothetical protein